MLKFLRNPTTARDSVLHGPPISRPRSPGFTITEVLVTLFIMATLSAVIAPALFSKLREGRATAIMQSLHGMNQAVAEYRKAVGRYPGQLTLLSTAPTVSNTDACGTVYTAAAVLLWRGPYLMRNFPATGIAFGDALLYPGIRRDPTTVTLTTPTASLIIDVGQVEDAAATIMDRELDNADGATSGTIQFVTAGVPGAIPVPIPAATAGMVNLSYRIPINPSAC